MFCKKCGQQINDEENFCGHCGVEIKRGCENFFVKTKRCPFCKHEIELNSKECINCKRIFVEKILPNKKHKNYTHKLYRLVKEINVNRFVIWVKKINFSKLTFRNYVIIIFGIIFLVWVFSKNDTSYNSGGTKAPLPPPVQQVSDDIVEPILNIPAVSLANGTILKKNTAYLSGNGKLYIKNGTSLDAVAKLIYGGSSVLTVYIKANSNYTITGISDGIYWLVFAQGLDWNSAAQKFRSNIQYSSFDETFDFITTKDYQYIYYPEFEVTLHSVVGGTAETSSVDPAQFNAY